MAQHPSDRAKRVDCPKCKKYLAEYTDQSWLAQLMRCGGREKKMISDIMDHCEVCEDANGLTESEIAAYATVLDLPDEKKFRARDYVENLSRERREDRHRDSANRRVQSEEDRVARRDASIRRKNQKAAEKKSKVDRSARRLAEKALRAEYAKQKKGCMEAMQRLSNKVYTTLNPHQAAEYIGRDIKYCKFMADETGNEKYTEALAKLEAIKHNFGVEFQEAVAKRDKANNEDLKTCEMAMARLDNGYYDYDKQKGSSAVVRKQVIEDLTACTNIRNISVGSDHEMTKKTIRRLENAKEVFKNYLTPKKAKETPKKPATKKKTSPNKAKLIFNQIEEKQNAEKAKNGRWGYFGW
jgi:hypothetical protein